MVMLIHVLMERHLEVFSGVEVEEVLTMPLRDGTTAIETSL